MTKAFALNFSLKALFFNSIDYKKRLPKLVRQPLLWLSYLDSNQDRQNQKLQCYHYTIRQSFSAKNPLRLRGSFLGGAKIRKFFGADKSFQ